jgi:DNA-binding NarL/FixJ family response regulator
MTVRVLIADDQQLVRTGFRLILETEDDIKVVGEATNGREAVQLARELQPDVVLMDIRMPELDGIEATRELAAPGRQPPTRVLILTTFDLDEYVFDALRAGASGFLLKDAAASQLAAGVRMVAAGDALLAPTITRRLIEEFTALQPVALPAALNELTPRELEIFRLLAKGMSNTEIAAELIIGETTVKTHVARLLSKLDLRDRIQAVVLAYETGIVQPNRRAAP